MPDAAQSGDRAPGHSHILLLLSLKLILLAFFILLNALSEFQDDKTRAVIDSVNRTFRGDFDPAASTVPYSAARGLLPALRNLLREIGSEFESIVPAARNEWTEHATALRVEMPSAALFDPGEQAVRPDRRELLRRLSEVVASARDNGVALDLEFLHGVPPAWHAKRAPGETPLEARRAGAVVRALVRGGIAPEALAIGLLPDRPAVVQFVVRPRRAPGPPDAASAPDRADG